MPGLVVVSGAQIRCNRCPGALSELVVTGGLMTPQISGFKVATVADHVAGENFEPFAGECMTTHKPCDPQTPIPWLPGESSVLLPSLVPLVSETAVLLCITGAGVIEIAGAGQSTLNTTLPADPECTPPPEPGFFEQFLDTLMMTDVANAPTMESCIVESPSQVEQSAGFALAIAPGVGVVARAAKVARGAKSAAATTAVTAELAISRYPSVVEKRKQIVEAAHRAAELIRKHKITIGPDGLPSSDSPKVKVALAVAKKIIEKAIQ